MRTMVWFGVLLMLAYGSTRLPTYHAEAVGVPCQDVFEAGAIFTGWPTLPDTTLMPGGTGVPYQEQFGVALDSRFYSGDMIVNWVDGADCPGSFTYNYPIILWPGTKDELQLKIACADWYCGGLDPFFEIHDGVWGGDSILVLNQDSNIKLRRGPWTITFGETIRDSSGLVIESNALHGIGPGAREFKISHVKARC